MSLERFEGAGGEAGARGAEEVLGQKREIFGSLAQARKLDAKAAQAVVKVLAGPPDGGRAPECATGAFRSIQAVSLGGDAPSVPATEPRHRFGDASFVLYIASA